MADVRVRWEVDGLPEALTAIGGLSNTGEAVSAALSEAGGIVQQEAIGLAPVASGELVNSITVVDSYTEVQVTADAPYAYTFHAIALGTSDGGFTFHYPGNARQRAYTRQAYIPDNPFMFTAWDNTVDQVETVVFDALETLWAAEFNG